ncbi:endoplasmic reticulum-based factor for assembly of V-ATPase-domain-containing protein [Coemansia spiralis]|uniref:Endoplasmic reticulum-based factor for assembly of V-ATPase n=1 Tax=Coemansia umbellata TaxID=1424467 RepID=A0ABQ8PJ39_9FUNG|nr:endoplasmic reticulum-based factor for assembly of V-ATPase-domain-containing protein [Coemansia spiralis]KAJ1990303.1 hypothetical protein EDC05_004156 [Coemansia umbellata]
MSSPSIQSDLDFEVTPLIHEACCRCIKLLPKSSIKPKEIVCISKAKSKKHAASATTISLTGVKTLSQLLRAHNKDDANVWVHQLLKGSRIHIAKPEPRPRNPKLVAHLDIIKKQLEEYEYQRMTASISSPSLMYREGSRTAVRDSHTDTLFPAVPGVRTGQEVSTTTTRQDMKDINSQISIIVNILFSALGVGFAVTYASYTLTSEIGWRILLGLLAAVAVALAETWLFAFSATRGQKKRLGSSLVSPNSSSAREIIKKKII